MADFGFIVVVGVLFAIAITGVRLHAGSWKNTFNLFF
jgi:hypothetical protein